ncbi:energy-coupling factor ABC transporter ATP-binding protein [Micromonospora sp. DR5-3]|uniref:energy-coupling factor ABC transporter ATP-binding protein n=1 Tax=unclassified Micromonospora TaxID=2617518 RepID=UPI0011D84B3B|nr:MULTISPECIES: ABC transporter ATP-binding protein [unclassified Micromonospora]MCW3818792.1 energy-coupling factor ABC transporter ATP-binding protein [Micromonospora sp. DR5-3]TYC21579.1 ABC transporter ATP-binding protein [Micromonospora sp. MP36]
MPIALHDVHYAYPDGTPAVQGVDLTLERGERLAIVGQNGAGKTTTVKLMNGLLRPTRGTVTVDGLSTATRTTAQVARQVGYVFQNPDDQVFAGDVEAELTLMPRYLRWDAARTAERVARAVELTGIGRYVGSNPNDLPFPVKKFVAIAAILVGTCDYVILDEPTAGLDRPGTRQLATMLDRLQDDGIAVVTITHDMRFVADAFPRVVAMADGTVIADGSAADVFADDDVLIRSQLQRLEVAQLARNLNLTDRATRIADVLPLIP